MSRVIENDSGGPGPALHGQHDDGPLRAADLVARPVDRQAVGRHAVDRQHDVAGQDAGLLGRRALDRLGHDEMAVRSERRAALGAVGGPGDDLRADPLELAADPLQALAVFLGGQVGGVRVAERLDHPADGALDEHVPVDRAAGIPVVDRVVGVPERLEPGVVGDRRARCGGRAAAHRVARHEQRGTGQDDDDGDRDRQEPDPPARRPRRRRRIEGGDRLGRRDRPGCRDRPGRREVNCEVGRDVGRRRSLRHRLRGHGQVRRGIGPGDVGIAWNHRVSPSCMWRSGGRATRVQRVPRKGPRGQRGASPDRQRMR